MYLNKWYLSPLNDFILYKQKKIKLLKKFAVKNKSKVTNFEAYS